MVITIRRCSVPRFWRRTLTLTSRKLEVKPLKPNSMKIEFFGVLLEEWQRALKPKFHYADFPVRGSFGEVGVMEFGLNQPTNQPTKQRTNEHHRVIRSQYFLLKVTRRSVHWLYDFWVLQVNSGNASGAQVNAWWNAKVYTFTCVNVV